MRPVVITGSNSGIGFEVARAIGATGAPVVLACRNSPSAEAAARELQAANDAEVYVEHLDLASPGSIQGFAQRIASRFGALDGLINNAGLMSARRAPAIYGVDYHVYINYLSHFELTGRLLPLLEQAPNARVVSVSSGLAALGDLSALEATYKPGARSKSRAYLNSKLAMQVFAAELDRRLRRTGSPVVSTAAHPALARTQLARNLPAALRSVLRLVGYTHAAEAARPIVAAYTTPKQEFGYFRPAERFGLAGPVREGRPNGRDTLKPTVGDRLWNQSERLTGYTYLSES